MLLKFAIPKGSLENATMRLLGQAGFNFAISSRSYVPVGDDEVRVEAPFDGIIIGRSNLPLAHEGDALFNVAAFKSVSRAEDRLEEFAAVHGA